MSELTNLPCSAAAFAGLSAEILQLGKSLRFRAPGASMRPLVRDGDLLLVRPVDACLIRVGEVVLCSSQPDHIVVHRVVRRLAGPEGYRFLVQGDQIVQPDGWIAQAQVYGRLAAIERAGVHIDMHQPGMRLLGWLAVLSSRGQLGRGGWSGNIRQLAKRLPIFSIYLS